MTTEATSVPERVATLEEGQKHLATKADLADLKVELKKDIAELKVRIEQGQAELKVLIERGQVNNTRWTVATIIAVGAIAVAVAALV